MEAKTDEDFPVLGAKPTSSNDQQNTSTAVNNKYGVAMPSPEIQLKSSSIYFSQSTVSELYSKYCDLKQDSVENWEYREPYTLPIDVTWVHDHFISIDNRRLYSHLCHASEQTQIITRRHAFYDRIEQDRAAQLRCFVCWKGDLNSEHGTFHVTLRPNCWGIATLFRCALTDPSFPIEGRKFPMPVVTNGRSMPDMYRVREDENIEPRSLNHDESRTLLKEAANDSFVDVFVSWNGIFFIKRLDQCLIKTMVEHNMLDHVKVETASFRPKAWLQLKAAADLTKDGYNDDYNDLYGSLCSSMLEFEDFWELDDFELARNSLRSVQLLHMKENVPLQVVQEPWVLEGAAKHGLHIYSVQYSEAFASQLVTVELSSKLACAQREVKIIKNDGSMTITFIHICVSVDELLEASDIDFENTDAVLEADGSLFRFEFCNMNGSVAKPMVVRTKRQYTKKSPSCTHMIENLQRTCQNRTTHESLLCWRHRPPADTIFEQDFANMKIDT